MRLLVDLFGHERRVAAFLGGGSVPVDVVATPLRGGPVEADHRHRVRGDRHDLVLAELHRLAGVPDESGDVRAEVVGAVTEPDDQRTVSARAHNDTGLIGVDRQQGERPVQPGDRRQHRGGEVVGALVCRRHEMSGNLRVRLGGEGHALGQQLGLERVEVLDDPVVDEGQSALGPAEMRVGVVVGRAAVSGPPGVSNSGRRRRQGPTGDLVAEVDQLARALAEGDMISVDDRDPGRVVAAVFQPGQALHDDVERRPIGRRTDVPHDSTHGQQPSSPAQTRPVCRAPRAARRHTQE